MTVLKSVRDNTAGFDSKLPAREDVDLALRLMKVARFVVVRRFLVGVHSDALLRVDSNHLYQAQTCRMIYRNHDSCMSQNKRAFAFFNSYIGTQYALAGRIVPATRYLSRALFRYPLQAELWKTLLKNCGAALLRSKTPAT